MDNVVYPLSGQMNVEKITRCVVQVVFFGAFMAGEMGTKEKPA